MDFLKRNWGKTPKPARKILVFIVGLLFIIGGMVMLVIPGPGWATIFLGLAILATEFRQAEKIRDQIVLRFKKLIERTREKIKR